LSSPHPYVGETPEDPHHFLYPIIILFGIIRAHTVNNNVFDVGMLFFFGFLGYG
jgi:TctA family transporter